MDWLYNLVNPGTDQALLLKNQSCMSTSTIATTIQNQSCTMASAAYDDKVSTARTRLLIGAGLAAVVFFFVRK